jgi:hypothetical protein
VHRSKFSSGIQPSRRHRKLRAGSSFLSGLFALEECEAGETGGGVAQMKKAAIEPDS